MGRKKIGRPDLRLLRGKPGQKPQDIEIPIREQVVVKEVPATIHWDNLPGSGRSDVEVIGKCLIYEDGSQDVIVYSEISEGAKKIMGFVSGETDSYSIEEKSDGI